MSKTRKDLVIQKKVNAPLKELSKSENRGWPRRKNQSSKGYNACTRTAALAPPFDWLPTYETSSSMQLTAPPPRIDTERSQHGNAIFRSISMGRALFSKSPNSVISSTITLGLSSIGLIIYSLQSRIMTTTFTEVKAPKVLIEGDDPTIVTNYVRPHSKNAGQQMDLILPPKVGGEFPVDENITAGKKSRRSVWLDVYCS